MKIEVGIYEKQSSDSTRKGINQSIGWKIVCDQEKIPYRLTDQPDCPVIVFDGYTPEWLADFMSEGGIGIITNCHPEVLPFSVDYVGDASIEYVDLSDLEGALARVQCLTGLFNGEGLGKIIVHENRINKLGLTPDEYPVFVYQPYGQGGCWYTGLPMSKLIGVLGDTLRVSNDFSGYSERITSVDKHRIARAMRNILIKAFHIRGLPYIHVWYYPNNYQSAFTFRIDIDGVYGDSLLHISQVAKQQGLKLTFFINKSLCEDDTDEILKIDSIHDIGSHADIHNLFPDYASNYQNVLQCKLWMDDLGLKHGPWFAAPRGMWNSTLHQALEDLGYLFTSDFGCCIGGFPFFPYFHGRRSKTLQIPVNPFSVERAWVWKSESGENAITPEYISNFWGNTIEQNYRENHPIVLYSHPEKFGAVADEVFKALNQRLAGLNIWKTTLAEFASWWLRRDRVDYSVDYDLTTNQVVITGNIDADISVHIIEANLQ